MLTRVVWPCILADGNLPALIRECRAGYRICTTRRDQQKLRELAAFQSISNLVPIEFIDTPTENPEPAFHMHRFVTAVQEAREEGAVFFNLWPDVVFANRTLVNVARAIRKGYAGCVPPSFRVVSETCVEEVINRFAKSPESSISIEPGELVRLGVRHMHPLSATSVANALHGRPDTGLLYRIPGEGFVSRTSCNWLFFDPQLIALNADGATMTSDPDPGRLVHIVSDSDDIFFLSLAPLTKELEIFRPNHSNNVLDIARLTMLPHVKVDPFLEPIDRVCTLLHYGPMTEAVWRPVVDRSEAAFRRVRMIRAFLQIWELLKEESCRQAARLISLALFSLKFPQGWLIEAPVTIFVPNDGAIEKMAPRDFGRLLDRRFRRNLLRAMLAHTAVGADSLPAQGEAQHHSPSGNPIRIRAIQDGYLVNETARVLKDLRCGPHRICIIDQVLDLGRSMA